ncbi:lipopolysaccharide biosynthesis protein [Aquincola sp. S2]|uniref:Lipopolysaccharide biosynthesis protein n=1 Tax=Pseudaquabacterium terrae TaxID=2732868 RepID=A0ABX2EDN1_9BURK|nr:lipopolysaccharide biosynthesis protein [Aquabacterium terrae]NRF66520.1 lipopolysaccharide biosynthesis protein [Aquabacterium terrae]
MTTLRSKVLSGLYWSGSARLLGQLFTWGVTLVVIRVLRPEDYGLLAMATVFVAFLTLMADIGLGQALVQVDRLDEDRVRQVFGAIIVVDCLLFLLQFGAAPLIADFFAEPRLTTILRALAATFLLAIFTSVPTALMSRELDFKRQSLIELGCAIIGSVTTLAMALLDYGVWALVGGMLVSHACRTIACNIVKPYLHWPRLSLEGVRGLILFGGQMTVSRLLWFIYSQADMFIAGKLLGKEALGMYSVAMHLASLPVQKISSLVNQVAFPAFARSRQDGAQTASYLLKAVRILSFFAFPTLWGMSATAPELVGVVLGAQWHGAVLPLQVLALVMPIRMISNFIPAATDGVGRADVGMKNLLLSNAVMLPAFALGSQWGLQGLCVAWLVASPVVFLLNLRSSLAALQMKVADVLKAMAKPALCALLMGGAILLGQWLPVEGMAWRLGLLIGIGTVAYLVSALLINKAVFAEILALRRT